MYSIHDHGMKYLGRMHARNDDSIAINPALTVFAALSYIGIIKFDSVGRTRSQESVSDIARQTRGVVERMAKLVERRGVREPGWVMIPFIP